MKRIRKPLTEEQKARGRKSARNWFLRNRDKALETNRKWRQGMKQRILEHYSNGKVECACCGEATPEFLTLDHVNNNGTKERKLYANGGHQHYRRIIKLGFPEGFQVLCFNCNCGRAKTPDKVCPHKRK